MVYTREQLLYFLIRLPVPCHLQHRKAGHLGLRYLHHLLPSNWSPQPYDQHPAKKAVGKNKNINLLSKNETLSYIVCKLFSYSLQLVCLGYGCSKLVFYVLLHCFLFFLLNFLLEWACTKKGK